MTRFRALAILALACVLTTGSYAQDPNKQTPTAPAQEAPLRPRTLNFEDYKQWERLGQIVISNDGRFLIHTVSKVDADGYMLARRIDGPEKWLVPNGFNISISDSSKWGGYLISVPKAEAEKNAEMKRPSPLKLGLLNFETGEQKVIEDISSYDFLKDQDLIVAIRPRSVPGPGGNDMLIFNPAGGEATVISNVQSYTLNEKENLMAIQIDSGTGYQALQVYDLKTGLTQPLYNGKDAIVSFRWAKDVDVLSVAVAKSDEKKDGNTHRVWRISGFGSSVVKQELDPSKLDSFPKGLRISSASPSQDGSKILLNLLPWKDKSKPVNPKDKAGVEVWNTKDIRPMPQQKKVAAMDSSRGSLYLWDAEDNSLKRVTPGKDDEVPSFDTSTLITSDLKYSIFVDGKPYSSAVTNGITYADVWLTNLATGEKTEAVHKNQFGVVLSETDRYFAYYADKLWWIYDIQTKRAKALHPDGYANFEDELDDHTVEVKPPAARPIWLDKDAGLIVHDRFDAWLCDPATGKMRKLTDGRKEKVRFRFLNTTPWEDAPKLAYPMHFDIFDTESKRDGIYVIDEKGEGKVALMDDVAMRRVTKAKNADRMMFTLESFTKSPDVYITNQVFSQSKPVTKTNPQQQAYKWGRSELVTYKSRFGVELQGTLIYPADYDASKKYPMVTYIYERLSDDKNAYLVPSEWSAYNQQYFSQNGYFVFMPDIAYKGNRPGESAVDCLEPAVDAVIKKNVGVDPKKVGLIGHSWGAYQTAFVTTVSDRFAVGACGAPLTELTSMYNSYYWNAGITDQVIFETSQGRMRVPFWEDPKPYFDNSPVWQSAKRKVPLLMAFGDQDGAVDWHQGQYLFNTLRRMGKQCVMLVYAGENHGLALRPNQLDYAKRLRHWLDVYLKGDKAEPWVTEGVPFLKQVGG